MSERTALVAGGAGFVGSHLCERLLVDGHEIVCLDNFESSRPANVSHLTGNERFELLKADIRDPPDLPAVDEIYHLTSPASPTDFTEFPVRIGLTNTEGTRNPLNHARDCGARMLYGSTSEVYGDPESTPSPSRTTAT